jgi:hypothetical protein
MSRLSSRVFSRLFLACSFLAALTTAASADRIGPSPSFAQPPPGWQARHSVPAANEAPPVARLTEPFVDRDVVRAKLAAARAENLARFRAYQRKGVFPSNTYVDGELNVWRDEAGHLCAAATIMNASGATLLVEQVAGDNNFIRLADVTSGPLLDWILTSGLTQAEIVAIQRPFSPVMRRPPVEPAPAPVVAVDPTLRRAEDLRLAHKYRGIEAMIVKNQQASLELAVDRLMAYPALARRFADS